MRHGRIGGDLDGNKNEAEEAVFNASIFGSRPRTRRIEGYAKRVVDSWDEVFAGYTTNAEDLLQATFNAEGYDGIVLLSNIEFHST